MKIVHRMEAQRSRHRGFRILVIGSGGNGSAILFGLPYLHHTLQAWGSDAGFDVAVWMPIRCPPRTAFVSPDCRALGGSWVSAALREHQTAWVNIVEPRLGASLHGTEYVTAPIAYLRLHGRNYKKWFNAKNRDERYDYLYTQDELRPIAKTLQSMEKKVEREPTRREAKKVIAATNNHHKGKAVVNAIDLKSLLGVKDNPVPDELLKSYPQLKLT